MGNLKEALKLAATLLKSGNNAEVIKLLSEYAEDSPDYRALCFIALAYFNNADYENSYKTYKKSVETDQQNVMAWKGAFKLFESDSKVIPDQFSLQICEFMQKNCDDKKELAAQVHRRLHVEMRLLKTICTLFEELQFEKDVDNLTKIVELLRTPEAFNEYKELLEKVFNALEKLDVLRNNSNIALIHCKFTKSMSSIISLLELHEDSGKDEWVQKRIFEYSCQEFFVNGKFPQSVNHVTGANPSTMAVLNSLKQNEKAAALEALDNVPDRSVYPDCLLFVGLLADSENWEAVEKVALSIRQLYPNPVCNGWIARSLFEIDNPTDDQLRSLQPLPLPQFAVESMKVAVLTQNSELIKELLEKFDNQSKTGIIIRLVKTICSSDSVTPEDVKLTDQLPKETCQDFVIAAETRIRAGLDANSLLVKAAKLNVRCSRAFFLLGKTLSSKNPTKAKSLLERAVQIRPGNEEYVKVLYQVLISQDVPTEDRLKVLKSLMAKRRSRQKPFWLSDALSAIYMETDKITEAVDELQQMVRLYKENKSVWARLADAYTRKGHLRAAVSSYAQLAAIEGGHEFFIPMIRVLLQLREFEEALEKVSDLREKIAESDLQCCSESLIVLDFTEAEVRLNLHGTTSGEPKRTHLKEALRLLTQCIDKEGSCKFATVFKLLGDAFLTLGKYAERLIRFFEIEKSWQINTPLDCINKATSFYMTVLRSQSHDALAWYDVSVALLAKYKLEQDNLILTKILRILEHSLTLTTIESLLSSIWTLLAEAKRLAEHPIAHQLHCLSRALQLNKANDAAWLKVAILCMEVGMMVESSKVLEQTIKFNPYNADAWCTWAQNAHLQGDADEALAMFRQALCIRPVPAAIVGYSTYLCDSLKKKHIRFDAATAALDFEPVLDLGSLASADSTILYHLGLLSDLFGYHPEALNCFQLCQRPNINDEIERALIKTHILHPEKSSIPSSFSPEDSRLAGLFRLSIADSFAILTAELEVYGQLYNFIKENDGASFRKLYMSCVKAISVPLFISGIIINKISLPNDFVRTMHDALPRHELIDYFPTVLPDDMDNGLRHLEQDGEEPFRYRHRAAKQLLEELKILREKADTEKADSEKEQECALKEEVPVYQTE